MQSELVQLDVAALAGESVWVGGKAIDSAFVCELEHMSRHVGFRVQEDDALVGGGEVENLCPVEAVFEIQARLDVIARGYPNIEASFFRAGFEHGVEGIGSGRADLARFFPDSEMPRV